MSVTLPDLDVDKAKEFFQTAAELSEKFPYEKLKKALGCLETFGNVCSCLGAVAGLIQAFLPDEKQEAIMHEFSKIHDEIAQVRDDIRQLENKLDEKLMHLQYAGAVTEITMLTGYCDSMLQNKKDSDKLSYYQNKIKDEGVGLEKSVDVILQGINGDNPFSINILEAVYNESGGSRPEVMLMAGRLMQLLVVGCTSLGSYTLLKYGEKAAKIYSENMQSKLKLVPENMENG